MKAQSTHQPTNQSTLTAKWLLRLEVIFCLTAIIVLLALVFFAALVPMADWQRATLIIIGIVQTLVVMFGAVKIEQIVGFYECTKCGHYYVPTYGRVFWAPHFGRTRYLKCPKCGQKSWQKKKLTKSDH